jgi:alkaline phosphatase D
VARGELTRRRFLDLSGRALAGALTAPALVRSSGILCARWPEQNPFSLGVASGDPSADGFVIWTRLAPDPLSEDPEAPGGVARGDIPIGYEIATDESMRNIALRGTATAEAAFAHSVHVEAKGLGAGRPYWYRFTSGDAQSPIGRALTAPAPGAPLDRLRFACASCANYEAGYFAAYRHLAAEQPDLVLFLGDYIYEYTEKRLPTVRRHHVPSAATLPTYRDRYAQYRLDPDLQNLHASVTALVTWDDHEVQNDYADRWAPGFTDSEPFLKRRAAAYQAFYEHMPVRPSHSRPNGPDMQLYDRFAFGDLVQFSVLDGRQHRSREACDQTPGIGGHVETDASCAERRDPARSMLGPEQEAWLAAGLSSSKARWNVIAQDVMMAQLRERQPDGSVGFWTDDWNGYPASRSRVLQHIHERRVRNPVVLGGDIHSFWASDLKLDFDDPRSPTVATELIGTSITSNPPPYEKFAAYLADNPHVRFFESRSRGYMSTEVTPERMTTRFQAISDPHDPDATVSTLATFVVEDGRPGPVGGKS